jgi:hypothetical protein
VADGATAIDAHAELVLGEPEPTPLLGIDETRFGAMCMGAGGRWLVGAGGSRGRPDSSICAALVGKGVRAC